MGRKILLVEDDRDTAGYLLRGLGEEGHSVEHVGDGREGLFLATGQSFDLIILDRMVPELDGLSLLKALRAAGIETPVLVLSALASVSDRIEGLETGVYRNVPELGEHGAEILAEAGLSPEEISELQAKGALGGA